MTNWQVVLFHRFISSLNSFFLAQVTLFDCEIVTNSLIGILNIIQNLTSLVFTINKKNCKHS